MEGRDFIPYQESLELEKLGFDEYCMECCYYEWKDRGVTHILLHTPDSYDSHEGVKAPTYSQAFRFFREKYGIHYSIDRERSQHDFEWGYNWSIYNYTGLCEEYVTSHPDAPAGEWVYKTYEEAELECLRKLIKIVKEK